MALPDFPRDKQGSPSDPAPWRNQLKAYIDAVAAEQMATEGSPLREEVTAQTTVAVQQLARMARFPWVGAGHRARLSQLGTLTNGTDTEANSAVRNIAPYEMTDIVVGYANSYSQSATETPGPNPITVHAAIQVDSQYYPLFIRGSRDLILSPGAYATFDPVSLRIPKGTAYYVWTHVIVGAGEKWPIGTFQGVASPYQDRGEQGTGLGDKTLTGGVSTTNNFFFGPTSIRARRLDGSIDIVGIGDSISFGTGDSQDRGMIVRAVNDQHPYRNLGYAGAQAAQFTARWARLRMLLAGGGTHWFVLMATNDIASLHTAATIKANLLSNLWHFGANLGAMVYAGTLPPRSTSTDSFATTANQTTVSTNSVRVDVNDWIRDGAPIIAGVPAATGTSDPTAVRAGQPGHPLVDYVEVADALESSRNSGIWKAAHTNDGIHPNSANGSAAGAVPIAAKIATFV